MRQGGANGGRQIVFALRALAELAAGFDEIAALLAVTLGPGQGVVYNAVSAGSIERLSDAGTIARRVVALPGRRRNGGAMMARHLAWRMHEAYGDGAATAAVLARALVREGLKRIAAGVEPTALRDGFELALPVALDALAAEAMPLADAATLVGLATSVTGEAALGAVLGEIVDLLGGDAALTIEEFPVPYLEREYVAGAAWRAHPASRAMIPAGKGAIVLDQPLVLLADQSLATAEDVRATLEIAIQATPRRPLLIVPAQISKQALATVSANLEQGTLIAVAALLSSSGPALTDDLGDLAVLTGGTVLGEALGRPPARARSEDLGTARRVTLSRETLTIVGGAGEQAAVAERAAPLRRRMNGLPSDSEEWRRLQGRVGRLSGGCVILKLGAHSGTELAERRARAEKAFRLLTGAQAGGVVPGGGAAYLACVPALRAIGEGCDNPEARHGLAVLLAALEAPFLQIARNQKTVHPPLALAAAGASGRGYGLDVRTGDIVDMREAGIVDSLRVTQGALELAVSSAKSLLMTGVVVMPPASKRGQRVEP